MASVPAVRSARTSNAATRVLPTPVSVPVMKILMHASVFVRVKMETTKGTRRANERRTAFNVPRIASARSRR